MHAVARMVMAAGMGGGGGTVVVLKGDIPFGSLHWFLYAGISCLLVLFAGIMSGLTLGLKSLGLVELERSGTATEKKRAAAILPVVHKQRQLLVTLLLCNAAAMQIILHGGVVDGSAVITKSITVNHSGQGDFKTIQEAINSVPDRNQEWIRIHVAQGIYREMVFIPVGKGYIFLEGEGYPITSIEWDNPENITFHIDAHNFVIKDIAFKNTYDYKKNGPLQALAAFIGGDKGSCYRCAFFGYQDTLCDFAGRHYFNNCWIEGGADFIFGFGQSIYENSTLNSSNTGSQPGFIVAQGKDNPNSTSGFVFKNCQVIGGKTYLGRAWQPYSTAVFYKTYMADNVAPQGWVAFSAMGHEDRTTFAEDSCFGPGSNTTNRVKWEKKLSSEQLSFYVSIKFIDQEGWLLQQP